MRDRYYFNVVGSRYYCYVVTGLNHPKEVICFSLHWRCTVTCLAALLSSDLPFWRRTQVTKDICHSAVEIECSSRLAKADLIGFSFDR